MLYAEHQAAVIGFMEMSCGIGLTISPVIGSFLYTLGGFKLPFIVFGCMFLGFSLAIKCILPERVDFKKKDTEDEAGILDIVEPQVKVTYCSLLTKAKIFFGCFSGALGFFTYA